MMSIGFRSVRINDDNVMSISAARLVWLAMRDAIDEGPTDFAPDYFFGYSHACMLTFVISHVEWEIVKNKIGSMLALKHSQEFAAKNLAASTGASPHNLEG